MNRAKTATRKSGSGRQYPTSQHQIHSSTKESSPPRTPTNKPKKTASAIWEEMRILRTQENKANRMIADLQKQYPQLRGYVGPHRGNKRKSDETFDGRYEAEPPAKRARSGVPHRSNKSVQEWHLTCAQVLKTHSKLEEFPAPVAWDCAHSEVCRTTQPSPNNGDRDSSSRTLRACAHNIRDACDALTKRQLKKYMILFHPDRFSACRVSEDTREEWKLHANEVFVVLSELWDGKCDKEFTRDTFNQKQSCTYSLGNRDPKRAGEAGCTCWFGGRGA